MSYTWSGYMNDAVNKIELTTVPKFGSYAFRLSVCEWLQEQLVLRRHGCDRGPTGDSTKCTATISTTSDADEIPTEKRLAVMNSDVNSIFAFERTATSDECSVKLNNRCDADSLDVKKFTDATS